MSFSDSIMELRYSWKKADGTLETWNDIVARVVDNVFSVVDFSNKKETTDELKRIMRERKFIAGGRFLAQAGREYHQVNNCFLLRAEDTREGWGDLLRKTTLALMSGGGIGIDYSQLRPEGSPLKRSGGHSAGALPLMKAVNEVGRGVMAGGKRRCLPKGTLVDTELGLIPIEEVEIGTKVKTVAGYKRVTGKLNQGIQKTININTEMGFLECTPNHRVAVFNAIDKYIFKRADELKEKDKLVFFQNISEFKENEIKIIIKGRNIKIDNDMAWLLGYFFENGKYFNANKNNKEKIVISYSNNFPDIKESIINIIDKFKANYTINNYEDYSDIEIYSSILVEFLSQFKQGENIIIPEFILRGSISIRSNFVAGIFDAVGHFFIPILLARANEINFILQVQNILSSLGISTVLKSRKTNRGLEDVYEIKINNQKQLLKAEKLIFKNSLKYRRPRLKMKSFYTFPFSLIEKSNIPKIYFKNKNFEYSTEYIEKIQKRELEILPVSVLSIEEGRNAETWDLEVEGEEFITNGFVVHNSAIWAGLAWNHGDIENFITMKNWIPEVRKLKEKDFDFPATMDMTNISVILDKEFFNAYENENHPLHQKAQNVYWKVIERMTKTGEPAFSVDYENKNESLRNACTEIVSEDDSDVCCLGSINMGRIESLEEMKLVTELAQLFLIVGTEYSDVPYEKVKEVKEKNRRTGLGLMGLHEWLIKHGYRYEENDELAQYLQVWKDVSDESAKKWADILNFATPIKKRAIAPNGTISIVGGQTTGGIEPIFSLAYQRRYLTPDGWKKQYVADFVAERLYREGYNIDKIEDSYDLSVDVERRIRFQAFVQRYVDNAISSTINLPAYGLFGNDDFRKFGEILYKYLPNLRGITTYPDGARGGQPLTQVDFKFALSRQGVVFEGNEECVEGVCGL